MVFFAAKKQIEIKRIEAGKLRNNLKNDHTVKTGRNLKNTMEIEYVNKITKFNLIKLINLAIKFIDRLSFKC